MMHQQIHSRGLNLKILIIFFCALLVISVHTYAQQITSTTDSASIVEKITGSGNDTIGASAYLEYGNWWIARNTDSCNKYLDIGGGLSNKLNFVTGKLIFLRSKIKVAQIMGENQQFLSYSKQLLEAAQKYKVAKYMVEGLLMYGTAQNSLGNVQDYLDYHIQAEKLAATEHLVDSYPQIQYNIGLALYEMDEAPKAIPYLERSIALCKKNKNDKYLCVSLYNMGAVQASMDSLEVANSYFEQSVAIGKKINYEQLVAVSLIAIGSNLSNMKQPEKGLGYSFEGLALAQKTSYDYGVMIGYLALFQNYFAQKDYKKAAAWGDKGFKMVKEKDAESEMLEDIKLYASLQSILGNYKKANEYLVNYTELKEKRQGKQVKDKIHQLEIQYQTKKKETQITDLKVEKQKQYILICSLLAGLVLFTIIGLLAYRNVQIKRKNAEQKLIQSEQEKQLTATAAILQAQEDERSRMAKDLHDGLGGMLSGIKLNLSSMKGNMIIQEKDALLFNKSIAQLDSAIAEMRRV
ncbi:MAG: tetratricopeptide repeat protein, partial [Ferruginibacter sp.]